MPRDRRDTAGVEEEESSWDDDSDEEDVDQGVHPYD